MDDEVGEVTRKLFGKNFTFVTEILRAGTALHKGTVLRLLNERGLTDTVDIPDGVSVEEFVRQAQDRLAARK
jgi:hypothetical protein